MFFARTIFAKGVRTPFPAAPVLGLVGLAVGTGFVHTRAFVVKLHAALVPVAQYRFTM